MVERGALEKLCLACGTGGSNPSPSVYYFTKTIMKILVIYDSFFGNTEKIAKSIAQSTKGDLLHVDNCKASSIKDIDYLIVGSPTRAFKPTEKIVAFIKSLPVNSLYGIKIMAFDTRVDVKKVNSKFLTFMVKIFGYAATPIEKALISKGANKAAEAEGFIVEESEGPLREGEEERAAEWGKSNTK